VDFYIFERMGQRNYIVFLCYGNERIFHECAYALLSLSRMYGSSWPKETEIWVYTDNPEWFEALGSPLPLNFRRVDMETIRKWRGQIDFVHRVKIEILKDFTENRTGNVLYSDTDVVFTNPVNDIFKGIAGGKLYMHIMEGKVSAGGNPIFRKLNNYLLGAMQQLDGRPMNEMDMWNAGVLGFNTRYKHLLSDVLFFTDVHYPKFPKHVVEQFAFSAYFQHTDHIKTAAPYIFHYWNLKEAGQILSSFFNHFKGWSWQELTRYSLLVQMNNLMQEKVAFLANRGVGGALSRKKWVPSHPDWNEMVKQLPE
jgi:hypothetical protein